MSPAPCKTSRYLAYTWSVIAIAIGLATYSIISCSHAGQVFDTLLLLRLSGFTLLSAAATLAVARDWRFQDTKSGDRFRLGLGALKFTATLATSLDLGGPLSMLCVLTGSLSASRANLKANTLCSLFSTSVWAISAYSCGSVFQLMNQGGPWRQTALSPAAVASATMVYFLLSTAALSVAGGIVEQTSPAVLWRGRYLGTAPGCFASAIVASSAVFLIEGHNIALAFAVLPMLLLTLWAYHHYDHEKVQRENAMDALREHEARASEMHLATVTALAMAIDAKDQQTHEHITRVKETALVIARRLGLNEDEVAAIATGALLHDVGKLGVPEFVLLKPGRLSQEEFDRVKKHTTIGAEILEAVRFPWPVIDVVRNHHERWDGSGYPDGLQHEEIPMVARVFAVADVYDSLLSARTYREAWTHQRAVSFIAVNSGKLFDPLVVAAFLDAYGAAPDAGSDAGSGLYGAQITAVVPTPLSAAASAARKIHRANSELWALYETTQVMATGMGTTDTLGLLLAKILDATGCSCAMCILQDGEDRFYVKSAIGCNSDFLKGAQLCSVNGNGPIVAALNTLSPVRAPYDKEELMLNASGEAWQELLDGIVAPLYFEGAVLGTICIYHMNPDYFTKDDETFLTATAKYAATSVHTALLMDRTRADAFTDPLTGLGNVRAFLHEVQEHRLGSSPEQGAFTLLFLDLDNFKPINDNFGHQQGDIILREVASLLRRHLRSKDKPIRYGGDEFLVILTDAGKEEALKTVERLERAFASEMSELIHPSIGPVSVAASIGIAAYPEDGPDIASLLLVADKRMYQHKAHRKLAMLRPDVGQHRIAVGAGPAPILRMSD